MTADLRVHVVDFSPFNLAFNHTTSFQLCSFRNVTKENNGRRFAINLDDDDNCVDFGFDENFNNIQNLENFTLSFPLM